MSEAHEPCLEGGQTDPLLQERYAAAFVLDDWYWLHPVTGPRSEPGIDRAMMLREKYGEVIRPTN